MTRRGRGASGVATFLVAASAVLTGIALVGCGRPVYAPHTQPPLSPSHTQGSVVERSLVLDEASTSRHEIPLPDSSGGVVLVGDVHGRGGSEIVVVQSAGVVVFGADGSQLAVVEVAEHLLAAGVLTDVDQDGRADVVTGVSGGADPVVRVFNGRGREILRRRLEAYGETFSAVAPAVADESGLYVVATENWIAGPRGVARLSLPRLEPLWFSAVPTRLTGLALAGNGVVVSNRTQHNGEFTAIGTEGEIRFGFDAVPHLLVLDPDGSPRVERALGRPDPIVDQSAWLLPIGPRTVVAHLAGNEERVVLADASSGIVFKDHPIEGRLHQLVSFPASEHVGYTIVTGEEDHWRLTTASHSGEVIAVRNGTGPPPRLLALLASQSTSPGTDLPSFLAIRNSRLLVVNASDSGVATARPGAEVPTTITGSVVVTSNDDELLVAGLGVALELVRIPLAAPSVVE